MRVPNNSMGGQWPVSGTGYAGFFAYTRDGEYREYIEAPLTAPLEPGQRYRVSFYVSLADKARFCVSSIGAYLSIGPTPAAYNYLAIPLTPQIQNTTGFLCDDTNWTLISGTYVAVGGEDHITIGNFSPDAGLAVANNPGVQGNERSAYYFIDAVSVSCECTATPVITIQPQHQTVPCGNPATLSGAATGQCEVRYRWICDDCYTVPTVLSNNSLFSGVNTPNLTLTAAAVQQFRTKTFRFEAYNDCGAVRSNGAIVDTIPPPLISQPADIALCPPETATFSVSAMGAGLQYRWFWIPAGQTTPIPFLPFQGSNGPALTFTALSEHCGARVFCEVTGPCGTTRSRDAVISCCPCETPPSTMALWLPFDAATSPGVTRNVVSGYNGVLLPLGSGPSLLTGTYVRNSLFFDGIDDYVRVQNHSLVNIEDGDLTVDAWIFTEGIQPGVSVIVDKRIEGGGNSTVGYHMFLVNDGISYRLGFQLADGQHTNWVAPHALQPGGWNHAAVTVDRDDPSGGRFYIDGAHVGSFNPTTRQGSLANFAPLTIGARSTAPSGYFWGGIDEVEVFRRALAPSEIAAIYNAQAVGKCKLFVQPSPPTIFCANGLPATIGAHLFNFTPNTLTLSGGFFPSPCPFTPSNLPVNVGNVTLAPATWAWVSANAVQPPGMILGDQACYAALFLATPSGSVVLPSFLAAQGIIVNRPDIQCGFGPATLQPLPLGATGNVSLTFGNEGIESGQFSWRVEALGPDGQPTRTLSIEGGQPGDALFGDAFVPVGETFALDLRVAFHDVDALGVTTLVLSTDTNGDGVYEPAAGASLLCVVPGPCVGDTNGDGVVNFVDLNAVLSHFGQTGMNIVGDINDDGVVNFADLNVVLAEIGAACD